MSCDPFGQVPSTKSENQLQFANPARTTRLVKQVNSDLAEEEGLGEEIDDNISLAKDERDRCYEGWRSTSGTESFFGT